MLLLSIVHQSYELNDLIPNIELLLSKIFFSPLCTRELRAGGNDKNNLLYGNIFADKKVSLPEEVYRSLLQTLVINPKKKHYKKLIAYIKEVERPERVTPTLLDRVVTVGISSVYPVTLGTTVRDFIVQYDFEFHRATFMKFVMFLEKCKGFEEDAKKFYYLTAQSSYLQIDYELIRPMVLRIIKMKTGMDTLNLFEQLRKNVTLNKSWASRDASERSEKLKDIKKSFYDGLIKDLMDAKSFDISEIVLEEKQKEKYPETIEDEIVAL